MPYIAPSSRSRFDPLIDQLAEAIVVESRSMPDDGAYAGYLNYCATRLALKVLRLRFGKMRYWLTATTVGVFHNVADELYRRVGEPYEDKQIAKNGDVDMFDEFVREIEA